VTETLAVQITESSPEGYTQFEKDIWQYAKDRLRCSRIINNAVCNSLFKTRSACGNPTTFGVKLVSVECKKCTYRPCIREACIESGQTDIQKLGHAAVNLDNILRKQPAKQPRQTPSTPTEAATIPKKRQRIPTDPPEEQVEEMPNEDAGLKEAIMKMMEEMQKMMNVIQKLNEEKLALIEENYAMKMQISELKNQKCISDMQHQIHRLESTPQQQQIPPAQTENITNQPMRYADAVGAPTREHQNATLAQFPVINSVATGPIYRPQLPKNLSRREKIADMYAKAKNVKELAELFARKDLVAQGEEPAEPRFPRTQAIKSCYIRTNIAQKEAREENGPYKAIRTVLHGKIGLPHVEDISILGSGFSIGELFYDAAHEEETQAKLEKWSLLLKDFDPLAPPPHRPEATREQMKEQFCIRRAQVYQRARFGLVREAALEGCDEEMKRKVKEIAVQNQAHGKYQRSASRRRPIERVGYSVSGTNSKGKQTEGGIPRDMWYNLNGTFVKKGSDAEKKLLELQRMREIRDRKRAAGEDAHLEEGAMIREILMEDSEQNQ
jgi:hypothetical protein